MWSGNLPNSGFGRTNDGRLVHPMKRLGHHYGIDEINALSFLSRIRDLKLKRNQLSFRSGVRDLGSRGSGSDIELIPQITNEAEESLRLSQDKEY